MPPAEAGRVDVVVSADLSQLEARLAAGEAATRASAQAMQAGMDGAQKGFDAAAQAASRTTEQVAQLGAKTVALQQQVAAVRPPAVGAVFNPQVISAQDFSKALKAAGNDLSKVNVALNDNQAAASGVAAAGVAAGQAQEALNKKHEEGAGVFTLSELKTRQLTGSLEHLVAAGVSGEASFGALSHSAISLVHALGDAPGGVAGALRIVGTTITHLVTNPIFLIATALGGAAAAVGVFYEKFSTSGRAEAALEKHKEALTEIDELWHKATGSASEYQRQAAVGLQYATTSDLVRQRDVLNRQLNGQLGLSGTRGALSAFSSTVGSRLSATSFLLTPQEREQPKFLPAINAFLAVAKPGTEDVKRLNEEFQKLALQDPTNLALQKVAASLLGVTKSVTDTINQMEALEEKIAGLRIAGSFEAAGGIPQDFGTGALQRRLAADLQAVTARSPGEQAAAARARETATPLNPDESKPQRDFRIAAAGQMALAQATHQVSEAERQRKMALEASLQSQRTELQAVGMGVAASTRLTQQTQLLAQAKQAAATAGVVVSTEEVRRINAAADAMGHLAEETARAKLGQDLGFQRSQLFRSPTEQSVAETMRGIYGEDFQSHMNDFEAGQIRINQRLSEFNDIGQDLTRGFLSNFNEQLQAGAGFFKSFETSGLKALTSIGQKLLQLAADHLWTSIFGALAGGATGGAGGATGGLVGLLAGRVMHGGGTVGSAGEARYVNPAAFAGAPRMHGGGDVDWAAGERPIIAKVGERVSTPAQLAAMHASRSDTVHFHISLEGAHGDDAVERIAYQATARGLAEWDSQRQRAQARGAPG